MGNIDSAPRVTAQPSQRTTNVTQQQQQTTRFQSVEPTANPPPPTLRSYDENPPPYCEWDSYPITPPEMPLAPLGEPSIGVNPSNVNTAARTMYQRPQLPEPLIPGLAPPPVAAARSLPTYRSKMEEAAQSGDFLNLLENQVDDVGKTSETFNNVIIVDWEVEMRRIVKELKSPPTFPKDAAALFNDELMSNSKLRPKNYLVNNPYLSDVQFKVGKNQQTMYGHKLLLMSASPVFLKKLAEMDEMELPDIEPEALLMILKYCYTEDKKFDLENIFQILEAARHFQLNRLLCDASQFAHDHLTEDKVLRLLEASANASNDKIKASCVKFIAEHEEKVFNSKGFKGTSLKTLMCVFKHCEFEANKRAEIVEKFHNRESIPLTPDNVTIKPQQLTGSKPKAPKAKPVPQQKQIKSSVQNSNILSTFEVIGPSLGKESSQKEEFEILGLIAKDDDIRRKIEFQGQSETQMTEFSRLDLTCKRSILIHEIGFTCNIGIGAKEARIAVILHEKNVERFLHMRVWKIDPKMSFRNNRLFLNKNPLKLYIGQKFTIKINFDNSIQCNHLTVNNFSEPDVFEARRDNNKTYFNCVSYIVVEPMIN